MRYKDLIEALQETDWDRIKSYANIYGKKHGINPKYILGLFNHESMIKDVYYKVGDQTFLQDIKDKWKKTATPEKWKDNPYVKAYGKEPEAHMSYGPGHFSVRALTKVQNSHPELKIGEKNVKDITWNDLKANDALAAELSVIHFRDLFNDPANKGNNDGETLLNAYTASPGSYRGKDKNSQKFGNQFMASINKFADIDPVATIDDPEQVTSTPAEQEKIKQRSKEIYGKLSDPDEWNKAITKTMNTITGSEKGDNLHKVPKGYYYDTGGNLVKIDPSKPDMTWSDWADPADETTTWNPQTWFPNLGGGPESEEGKNKRMAALNKKKQAVAAGPKTPKSIKPSNTELLSTQLSNTNESKTFKEYLEEANSKYIVSMNPNDKKWYVMGHVGNNKWIPVSNGFKNKAQAQKWAKSQDKVDIAARGEISGA